MCQLISEETGSKKPLGHWKQNNSANESIDEVSSSCGIPHDDLMFVITGGKLPEIRGTYCHPDLVPQIAQWASPKFAIRVSRIVNEYLSKEAKDAKDRLLQKKDDKIDKLLHNNKQLKKQLDELMIDTKEVLTNTKVIKTKLNTITNDRVIKTGKRSDESVMYIVENNDKQKKGVKRYSYGVILTARKSINSTLSNYKIKHPKMKIIKKINYTPNSINLWTRIRNNLKKRNKISGTGCKFNLCDDFSERRLIKYIEKIHNERLDTETI